MAKRRRIINDRRGPARSTPWLERLKTHPGGAPQPAPPAPPPPPEQLQFPVVTADRIESDGSCNMESDDDRAANRFRMRGEIEGQGYGGSWIEYLFPLLALDGRAMAQPPTPFGSAFFSTSFDQDGVVTVTPTVQVIGNVDLWASSHFWANVHLDFQLRLSCFVSQIELGQSHVDLVNVSTDNISRTDMFGSQISLPPVMISVVANEPVNVEVTAEVQGSARSEYAHAIWDFCSGNNGIAVPFVFFDYASASSFPPIR